MKTQRFVYNEITPAELAIIKVWDEDDTLRAVIRPPCPEVSTHHSYQAWLITSLHEQVASVLRQACERIIRQQPEYRDEKIRHQAQFGQVLDWNDNGTYHVVS
jgi:hypothetical protein